MPTRNGRKLVVLIGLAVFTAVALAWWWRQTSVPEVSVPEQLRLARRALDSGNYDSAETYCRHALEQDPESVPALLLAGEAAMKDERFDAALGYFLAVPKSDNDDSILASLSAGEVARALGHLSVAEREYRAVLARRPKHLVAQERMAFVLDLQGRRWESTSHLLEILRQDRISFSTLIRLGTRESAIPFPDELKKVREAGRDQATVKLADAVNFLAAYRPEKAEPLLREAIRLKPDLREAHARLGILLSDRNIQKIPDWERQLPKDAKSHPDVWVVRGLWCRHVGQSQAAIRCFSEAVARDPNQRVALNQLGQLLAAPEFARQRNAFAKRAELLQKLAAMTNQLSMHRQDTSAMMSASKVLEKLGRYWEAYGWCGLILFTDPSQESARTRMRELHARLAPTMPLTAATANPMSNWAYSSFPLPTWPVKDSEPVLPTVVSNEIRFVDRAADAGLEFTYFNSHDAKSVGTLMHEFAGGGVGVLDFDWDGNPDVYLAQGCRWPPKTESTEHRDRIFRNLGDGRFQDVTDQAGLGDGWFSQGVAVGDIDNDGFPDIYLANIGRNRLYRNNGDGTFQDITDEAGITGNQWTISCLIADLNGDGCPDLYDVNYLKGDDLFKRLCLIGGQRRACVPSVFPAERDRIYLNECEGLFREVTGKESSPLEPARAGMGIVAADFDGSGRLSLFIANDVVANAFLVNKTKPNGPLVFEENALLAGLAFDRDGRAQACMGVAADDVDGNGLLDLFVTNYFAEPNALYLQTEPGVFVESARSAGLYEPTYRKLGFGTQFLDADLDGTLDLVVANGHLDDFRYMKTPYRMNPQLFINRGAARSFQEADSRKIGRYFEQQLLGRSLAVLDWNRDGRPDFIVSHLETPVALVANETSRAGRWVKFRLHAVNSARDAIGTTIRIECGKQTWTRQLTAGSGYEASNERMLLFGLGEHTKIDRITVRWPSGKRQAFEKLQTNREFMVVEGRSSLIEQPKP